MAVPSNGPISIQDLVDEWGDSDGAPSDFSEFYSGGANVGGSASGLNGAVPASGELSLSDFLGAADAPVLAFESHNSTPYPIYFSPQNGAIASDFTLGETSIAAYGINDSLAYYKLTPFFGSADSYVFGDAGSTLALGGSHTAFWAGIQHIASAVTSSKTLYVGTTIAPTAYSHVESGGAASWGLRACSSDTISTDEVVRRVAVSEIGKVYLYDFDSTDTGNEVSLNTSFTENTASQEIGYSIAMDHNGETLVASLVNGTIKTYTRVGDVWSSGVVADLDATVNLTTTDATTAEIYAVRISGDGDTLVVGYNGVLLSGPRVAIYERVANAWVYRTSYSRTLGQFSNTAPGVGQPNVISPDRSWYNASALEYQTKNDWLDIDYSGTRVAVGDVSALAESLAGSSHQGRIDILDSTTANWASYSVSPLFPPAEIEHTDPTFQTNTPWSVYNFGATFRLHRNGSFLVAEYYPSGHSGATTNEIYVHTVAYGLSRPTMQELPTDASVSGTEYILIGSLGGSELAHSHKGYHVSDLKYDSSTTELSITIRSPEGEGVSPPAGFLTSLSIRGDWGSGEETKIFYANTATVTLVHVLAEQDEVTWTWSVTASEQFVDTNTYYIQTT